ncbi:hypothetical protein DSO57_1023534 [Entomophthora muscae]|uniref:Uncharacterized protein n=1 Tax=Entomophthora muscae TaxID=34485 RepID=A0ACC2RHT0_9FUNG|nr:hypothetical protein DSO57_1023534 [Entomophthora muscae]
MEYGGKLDASPKHKDHELGGSDYSIRHENATQGPRNMSLRHVTIKQVKDIFIPDDPTHPLLLDDHEIRHVALVAGLVGPPDFQSTSCNLAIDDGTGLHTVRFWASTESGNDSPIAQQLKLITPRTYIQIIGSVKAYGGKTGVTGIHVRPIEDPNEIAAHFLECIHTHLVLAKPRHCPNGFDLAQQDSEQNFRRMLLQFIYLTGGENGLQMNRIKLNFVNGMVSSEYVESAVAWLLEQGHCTRSISDAIVATFSQMEEARLIQYFRHLPYLTEFRTILTHLIPSEDRRAGLPYCFTLDGLVYCADYNEGHEIFIFAPTDDDYTPCAHFKTNSWELLGLSIEELQPPSDIYSQIQNSSKASYPTCLSQAASKGNDKQESITTSEMNNSSATLSPTTSYLLSLYKT